MSTARRIHIANSGSRNATVVARSVNPTSPDVVLGVNGEGVEFRRYVAAGS